MVTERSEVTAEPTMEHYAAPRFYFARRIGSEAAQLLFPTVQWEEARVDIARAWRRREEPMPWVEAERAVSAGWKLAVSHMQHADD